MKRIHCCIHQCIAFTGIYKDAYQCPCGEPRYQPIRIPPYGLQHIRRRALIPRPQSFYYYIPLTPRLLLQWANPTQAQTMIDYVQLRGDTYSNTNVLSDFWGGRIYEDLRRADLFQVFEYQYLLLIWT